MQDFLNLFYQYISNSFRIEKEMEQSRLEKYKEYRNSIVSEDAPVLESLDYSNAEDPKETTSTLPIKEVMQNMYNEDQEVVFLQAQRRKKIILYSVLITFGVLLIAAIVVVGILLFK